MDKEEAILQLKLIDLKLEKEKEIYSLLISILAGLLAFLVTSNYLLQVFSGVMGGVIVWISRLRLVWALIIILLLIIITPLLSGFITNRIFYFFLRAKERMYEEKIKEVENLLNSLIANNKK